MNDSAISPSSDRPSPRVAVVGGGLAGIAVAAAAVEEGCRVDLYEQAAFLGGRAGSFHDPAAGQLVNFCQHLAIGCCTNLLDLCRRMDMPDAFHRCRTLHFFAPDGRRSNFRGHRLASSPFAPPPRPG